jgi:tetratricopeptide (TPR) repeat protein
MPPPLFPRMKPRSIRTRQILGMLCILLSGLAPRISAQTGGKRNLAIVDGSIRDSQDQAVPGVAVTLDAVGRSLALPATTDTQGRFRFEAVPAGTYTLHTASENYSATVEGPFVLHAQETKSLALHVAKLPPKGASAAIEYSDETQFTVAGVTDTTALGGHGSDRVVRNSEALTKDAASLAREKANPFTTFRAESTEASLRASLAKQETAEAHFQLAEIEESHSRPLEAVKDYRRAAELQPTESYLFAWAAELLLHHAFEPAAEVFTKARQLHPRSVRIALGLGAAMYAQGLREEAGKIFLDASDLNPSDPAPYLFLGRLQATEDDLPSAWVSRMKRFVDVHPENATAHCLYAAALAKQGGEEQSLDVIEAQLISAIALDPHLGSAYLQLGILHVQRKDYPGAITALQKAIEYTPFPDEAHFRLADIYRRAGDTEKASQETRLFKQISAQKKMEADRERHEIQQFVYTLRGQTAPSQPPASSPR